MKGKIIAVVIIAIVVIAGLAYIAMAKDSIWVDPWPPSASVSNGAWGEIITLTFADGHTEVLNNILSGNLIPAMTVSYKGSVVTSITYTLQGKASQSGSDFNEVIVQMIGAKMRDSLISNSGYVTAWDFNSDGAINAADASLLSGHIGETGVPGWIVYDLNYDGIIDGLDVSTLMSHIGSTTGSGLISTYLYTNNPILDNRTVIIDSAWHSVFTNVMRIADYGMQSTGTYVVTMKMEMSGTPRYAGHSTTGGYYSDWTNVPFPPDRNIVITVGHGTLTFVFGTAIS